jgi:hypothetical protein
LIHVCSWFYLLMLYACLWHNLRYIDSYLFLIINVAYACLWHNFLHYIMSMFICFLSFTLSLNTVLERMFNNPLCRAKFGGNKLVRDIMQKGRRLMRAFTLCLVQWMLLC